MSSSIIDLLQELGLSQYLGNFDSNDIDLETLKSLSSEELREIGIDSLGHRKKILQAVSNFAASPSPISQTLAPTQPSLSYKAAVPKKIFFSYGHDHDVTSRI